MENSTEQSQKGKNVFMTMVGLLGLNAEVKDKASGKNIILSVSTDEPGRLIGRNGSSLDSVGLLMNRILRKEDNTFPKVIIDVDGYDKRSKNDRRKKRNKANPKAQKETEKTVVMSEESAEHEINLYVDDESGKVDPITTVAPGEQERKSERRDNNRRNNRRDNNRNNNRRNNRRDNNRNESAPAAKQQEAPKTESKPAPAAKQESSVQVADKPAPATKQESSVQVADKPAPAAKQQEAPKTESKPAPKAESKPKSSPNRLQMQCRNAAKEVKRWGEDVLLPPLSQEDCEKAIQHFANDKEIKAQIDNSKSSGDKKRVKLTTVK